MLTNDNSPPSNEVTSTNNSNDLLSYDKSNESNYNKEQPTTNINHENTIPITVSAPNIAPASDPIIMQLQASIRAMARRIDTVQETTAMKFESIHSDFRHSQSEMALILRDGLDEISKQRIDDMQYLQKEVITRLQRPPSPPPTVSFLGSPSIRSTTSSLGDPPASSATTTSHNSRSTDSKPDPPETPSYQKIQQKQLYRPDTRQPVSHPTPSVPSTPTPQPQTTTQIITAPSTPTIIVKTQKDPTPMTFKTFKKDHSYSDFKTACLIRANTDTYYSNLVTKNSTGRLIWNDQATEKESQILHLATTTAMGVSATNLIDRSDHTPCGIDLWKTLDKHYLKSYKSLALKDKLKKEYETIQKDSNESYTKYVSRVEAKIEQLEYNEIKAGTMAERAYRLIDGLKMPSIFGDILMKLETDDTWHKNLSLRDIMQKAEDHHELYVAIHGQPHRPAPRPSPTPRPPPQQPRARIPSTPREAPREAPRNPQPPPAPTAPNPIVNNPYNTGPNTEEKQRIKAHLAAQNNKLCAIYGLVREHQLSCPLHHNARHPLIDCYLFNNICQDCGAGEEFTTVRNDLGLGAMPERPDYRTPRPPAPYNNTNQTTPHARRALQSSNRYQALDGRYDTMDESTNMEQSEPQNPNNTEAVNDTNESLDVYPPLNLCSSSSQTPLETPPSMPQSPGNNMPAKPQFYCRYSSFPIQDSSTIPPSIENTNIRAVIDSGASHTMTNNLQLFDSITYFEENDDQPTALMGDDTTALPIKGYGLISFSIDGRQIRTKSYYVPKLGLTLLSVRQHIKYKGCGFHAERKDAILAFPTFVLHPNIDQEIELNLVSIKHTDTTIYDFDEMTAIETSAPSYKMRSILKHNLHHRLTMYPQSVESYVNKHKSVHFTETVEIQRLTNLATLPTRGTNGSIGYDVSSVGAVTIQPNEIKTIPTGLITSLPSGMYLRVAPRSSLSLKHITVEGGVIDADYRGEIKILLKNNSDAPFSIIPKQRIAQFIFEKASTPYLQVVQSFKPTTRKGGFGSTDEQANGTARITSQLQSNDDIILHDTSPYSQHSRRIKRRDFLPTVLNKPDTDNDNDTAELQSPADPLKMAHPPLPSESDKTLTSPSIQTPSSSSSVNAASPKAVSMTRESLLQSIGYLHPDKLLKHMKELTTSNVTIETDKNPKINPGSTASIRSKNKNRVPNDLPSSTGKVWHMDIGFGPCTSIGGIKYTLLFVDKRSRYKLVYGLKNLKSSLLDGMKQFLAECGPTPKILRTDFDSKLMGGKVADLLTDHKILVQSAPPYRQHQNGLVERHWQTVVAMARNWLTSSLLPSRFWFFAIKRACEVCNLLPTSHLEEITTPHQIQFGKKVDLRQLFPMFSVAYIKYPRDSGQIKNKWMTKSLKCIVVGKCSKSDGLTFYHPPSKQTISCGDGYKFDTFSPSGPQFNQQFDGNFVFSTKGNESALHRPPSHEEGATAYITHDNGTSYHRVHVLSVPINDDDEKYTVQQQDSGDLLEVLADELLNHNPTASPLDTPQDVDFPHLPWIKSGAKVTLYLSDRMVHPKQGTLAKQVDEWVFIPGRKQTNTPMPLPLFTEAAESLVHNRKLFHGWQSRASVLNARQVRATSNVLASTIFARKVSAKNLNLMQAPTLLKHHKLHPEDKEIWDEAYKDEYDGLKNIDTWETISEEEYQRMRHLYKGIMPTMAIATIKYDGDGKPVRAKYRIVALGNLDHNSWSKSDCFAPVLSQFELRFLTALAARKKCIPKTGDVNQAFCQSFLPPDEHYICRPPAGCPITPPDTYFKLKKTLYGLKRSPRHFYALARKILQSVGLQQHPTSPCIFSGVLIKGQPPLYLGLYVDDFLYFSESEEVEKVFEERFGNEIDTDFNGQIGYFLGINFDCTRHEDNHVTIHLSQEAFVDNLCEMAGLLSDAVNTVKTPYKSGFPVDTIPFYPLPKIEQDDLIHTMQVYIGCLTWLSISTRPDIATITNILAKYTTKCTSKHIDQVKRTIRYLKGTKTLGISFTSRNQNKLESHVKFPMDNPITGLCDANWGPQDQSKPRENEQRTTSLFTNRSLSGFLIYFSGPLHWVSKRQTVTARSSAEAEIYATDECTKCLLQLHYIISGLNLTDELMKPPTIIYNDNSACVSWSRNSTTKGLRHIQIRENAVRESVQSDFITVEHIQGKLNLADMFTKEDKDTVHFLTIRDVVLTDRQTARLGLET